MRKKKAYYLGKVFAIGILGAIILAMALPQTAYAQGGGNALNFDGNGIYIDAGQVLSSPSNAWTYSAWFNGDVVVVNNAMIMELEDNGGGEFVGIGLVSENPNFKIFSNGKTPSTSNTNPEVGVWYHIVLVWDESEFILYVNGQLDYSVTPSSTTFMSGLDQTRMGYSSEFPTADPSQTSFDGRLDEVRIWDVARTQSQIRDWMHKTEDLNDQTGLVSVWHLNESSVSSPGHAIDSKGTNNGAYNGGMTDDDCVTSTAPFGTKGKFVATQIQTNVGPTGGQIKVSITSTPSDANNLGVYQFGSLASAPVTAGETFPNGFNKRSNIVWGVTERGAVTATLVFDYSQQPGVSDPSTIEILKRDDANDTSWLEVAESSRDNGAKTITLTGVTEFSEYALGAKSDNTFPVELSVFTAQYLNNVPTLYWQTQSETNNAGWNIYRGETNEALSNEEAYLLNLSLGLIPGAGSTSEPTEYSFEDFFPVYQGNIYFYWLESVDYSGESEIYGPISLVIPEEDEELGSPEIPSIYGLHQNYPNPFNPNTEISFMMKESCIGELSIFNIKGQKIRNLFKDKTISRDELIIVNWGGKDESGIEVSTGVYYYKLMTSKGNFVRKMILLK